MLDDAIKFIGGTFVVSAILAWLIRSLVTHFLSKDVESYKLQLQSEAATELEKLKHQLRLVAAEHEARTSLLQETRSRVIAELNSKLIDFIGAAESLVSLAEYEGEPSKPEKANVLGERAHEFRHYFIRHRIYFTEDLCAKVEALFEATNLPALRYRIWLPSVQAGENTRGEYHKAWIAAWEALKDKVPPLEHAVRREFRELLGVEARTGIDTT